MSDGSIRSSWLPAKVPSLHRFFPSLVMLAMLLLHMASTKHSLSFSIRYAVPADQTTGDNDDPPINVTSPRHGDTFAPGTLPLNVQETFQRCYVDEDRYTPKGSCSTISISKEYGLVFHLVPKSASSSLRRIMKRNFNATEYGYCKKQKKTIQAANISAIHFAFFRDPLTRFISGFSEITTRKIKNTTPPTIPSRYAGYLDTLYGHLHNNTLSLAETNSSSETSLQRYKDLTKTETGTVAFVKSFEQFVSDYDGVPFDTHIVQQVAAKTYMMKEAFGVPLHLAFQMEDGIVNQIHDVVYPKLAGKHNDALPKIRELNKRANSAGSTSSFVDHLSTATIQKICQLSALDYCCLNYPLPSICQEVVKCQWTSQTMPGSVAEREGLLSIQPVNQLPEIDFRR